MCQLQPMLMWISTFIKHNIQYLCHCVSSSMASRYRMKYVVNTHEKGSRPAISKYLPGKIKWTPTAISSSVSLIPRLLLLLILSSGQKELIIIIFLFMLWHLYSLSSLGYSHFIYTTYRYILLYLRICGAAYCSGSCISCAVNFHSVSSYIHLKTVIGILLYEKKTNNNFFLFFTVSVIRSIYIFFFLFLFSFNWPIIWMKGMASIPNQFRENLHVTKQINKYINECGS